MKIGIYLDIASLGILFVLIVIYGLRRNLPTKSNTFFKILMLLTGFVCLANINLQLTTYESPLFSISRNIQLLQITLLHYVYIRYLNSRLNRYIPRRQKHVRLFDVPIIVSSLILITEILADTSEAMLEETLHVPLVFMQIARWVPAFYFFYGTVLLIRYRRLISLKTLTILWIYTYMPIIGYFFQFLIKIPGLNDSFFIYSVILMLLYLTVENPEQLVDGNTGLFNRDAFFITLRHRFLTEQPFSIVLYGINNYASFLNILTPQTIKTLDQRLASPFIDSKWSDTTFRISEDQFAVIIPKRDREEKQEVCERALRPLAGAWNGMIITGYVCPIDCPEEIGNEDEFTASAQLLSLNDDHHQTKLVPLDRKKMKELDGQLFQIRNFNKKNWGINITPIHYRDKVIGASYNTVLRIPGFGIADSDLSFKINNDLYDSQLIASITWNIVLQDLKEDKFPAIAIRFGMNQWYNKDFAQQIIQQLKDADVDPSRLILMISEYEFAISTDRTLSIALFMESHGIQIAFCNMSEHEVDYRKEMAVATAIHCYNTTTLSYLTPLFQQFCRASNTKGWIDNITTPDQLALSSKYPTWLSGPVFNDIELKEFSCWL